MKLRAEELVGRMSQLVEPAENWHEVGTQDEPVFENSWINYNSTTHQTMAFYKHNGRVYLKGLIKSGSIPSVAFTLPEGYRPPLIVNIGTVSNATFGAFNILSDGSITIIAGNTAWVSLDGASFRI